MSDRWLWHDLDLRHARGFVAVGCPDTIASRIAATDDKDFLFVKRQARFDQKEVFPR